MEDKSSQLVDYVKTSFEQNVPEDEIRKVLASVSWDEASINEAMVLARNSLPTSASNHKTPEPQKYKIRTALQDAYSAIKNNIKMFIFAIIISYGIAIASSMLVIFILALLFGFTGGSFTDFKVQFIALFVLIWLIGVICYCFLLAFIQGMTSFAIYSGNDENIKSLKELISKSLSKTIRVAGANILFSVAVFWPYLVMIVVSIILLVVVRLNPLLSILFTLVSVLLAIVWAFVALARYSLAPYVALYEPEIKLTKTLKRSSQLLDNGGQWFLVKGFAIVFLIAIVLSIISGTTLSDTSSSQNIIANIIFTIISIIANSVIVMLYRNRRVVKGL